MYFTSSCLPIFRWTCLSDHGSSTPIRCLRQQYSSTRRTHRASLKRGRRRTSDERSSRRRLNRLRSTEGNHGLAFDSKGMSSSRFCAYMQFTEWLLSVLQAKQRHSSINPTEESYQAECCSRWTSYKFRSNEVCYVLTSYRIVLERCLSSHLIFFQSLIRRIESRHTST